MNIGHMLGDEESKENRSVVVAVRMTETDWENVKEAIKKLHADPVITRSDMILTLLRRLLKQVLGSDYKRR